jgi:alkylation response protein AidB-like acyl-CoA dehydrogenase
LTQSSQSAQSKLILCGFCGFCVDRFMVLDLTEEQRSFKESIERFAHETIAPQAAQIDESGEFPIELMRASAAEGLAGVTIPAAWGGAGRDYVSYALAIETVARASATVAAALVVTNSLVAELIAYAASEPQKDRWLRALATGQALGAFALSEANAGTDAANQQTTAERAGDGRTGVYKIKGRKVWVANAEAAEVAIVFASTRPGLRAQGVTAFLVPMDTPGITRRARDESLGVRGLGCMDLAFDVTVGDDQVLGAVDQGFRLAMWALDGGRVAIAAQALGIGEAALDAAIAHAKTREQFGEPIANYQAIQWMLADSATELAAARLLTWKAADAKDRQERSTFEASMAKLAASEAAHRAADRAMQVLASAGYRRGSVVERLFRDVRATEIYQGTSEAQRMIIAEAVLGDRSIG